MNAPNAIRARGWAGSFGKRMDLRLCCRRRSNSNGCSTLTAPSYQSAPTLSLCARDLRESMWPISGQGEHRVRVRTGGAKQGRAVPDAATARCPE